MSQRIANVYIVIFGHHKRRRKRGSTHVRRYEVSEIASRVGRPVLGPGAENCLFYASPPYIRSASALLWH